MRLIFSKDDVKREIEGPFEMCASRADLMELRSQLNNILAKDDTDRRFTYGWFSIWPAPIPVVDTAPKKWTQQ